MTSGDESAANAVENVASMRDKLVASCPVVALSGFRFPRLDAVKMHCRGRQSAVSSSVRAPPSPMLPILDAPPGLQPYNARREVVRCRHTLP